MLGIRYLTQYVPELPFTYHQIGLEVDPGMHLVDIWVEPGTILNYNYDPNTGNIDLLYLYNYNQLQQMALNDEEVCFYVLLCKNDKICKVKICISAKKLLENVPAPKSSPIVQNEPQEPAQPASIQNDITLYIVPNPAHTDFTVAGIAEKDIAELKLLDMSGKELKTEKNRANMHIGNISPAVYIVRVIDANSKVYYLKLVKQ